MVEVFKRLAAVVLLTGLALSSSGQNVTKVVRIRSGGILSFNISSITDYSNGKTYNNWSRLNITFTDTTNTGGDGASIGWRLNVRAGSAAILTDGGGPNLPLSHIRIRPTTTISGATVTNVTLSASDQELVSGPDPGTGTTTGEITLSYDFGTVTPLIGSTPDYYYVELIFTLTEF